MIDVCHRPNIADVYANWSPTKIAELAMIEDRPREFVYEAMLCAAYHLLIAGATVDDAYAHGKAIADEAARRFTPASEWGQA